MADVTTYDNKTEVFLSADSAIPDQVLDSFTTILTGADVSVRTDRRPSGTMYFSTEWYIPTAIVLGLAAPYFAAMLGEAGRKHYRALKRGFGALAATLFGEQRTIRFSATGSPPGKVDADWEYSRGLSIFAGADGIGFKLFLLDGSNREELEAAFSCFLEFMASVHSGAVDELLSVRLQELRPSGGIVVLTYDPAQDRLCFIDVRAHGRRQRVIDSATLADVSATRIGPYLKPVGVLPYHTILALHEATLAAELAARRDALVSGLDPHFRATLPASSVPADQVLLDLTTLNLVESLQDGSAPLAVWLATASAIVGPRPEARVFQKALEEVRLRHE